MMIASQPASSPAYKIDRHSRPTLSTCSADCFPRRRREVWSSFLWNGFTALASKPQFKYSKFIEQWWKEEIFLPGTRGTRRSGCRIVDRSSRILTSLR